MRRTILALTLVLSGCSLLFDSSRHTEGEGRTDGGADAGRRDSGGVRDSGTPAIDSGLGPDSGGEGPECQDHSNCVYPLLYCAMRPLGRRCVATCIGSDDCAGYAGGQHCSDGKCGCRDRSDCTNRYSPQCGSGAYCVECLADADCTNSDRRFCAIFESCVQCRTDEYCMQNYSLARCTDYGSCVECIADTDCPNGTRCVSSGTSPGTCM